MICVINNLIQYCHVGNSGHKERNSGLGTWASKSGLSSSNRDACIARMTNKLKSKLMNQEPKKSSPENLFVY